MMLELPVLLMVMVVLIFLIYLQKTNLSFALYYRNKKIFRFLNKFLVLVQSNLILPTTILVLS